MRLKSIGLEGYRSARHGCPIVMEGLGRFNVLIGPNNSGKSTVLRFLEVLASLVRTHDKWPIILPWQETDRSWWWQGALDQPIRATLLFESPAPQHELDSSAPGKFEDSGEWRVTIQVTAKPSQDCTVLPAPNVFLNGDWYPVARPTEHGDGFEFLNRIGNYVSSSSMDACPYLLGARTILHAWATSTRFYDAVRAMDRTAGRRGLADGSELLKDLSAQQLDTKQAFAFEKFRSELIKELNALISDPTAANPIESIEVKGTDPFDLFVKRKGDDAPIALEHMGTGIAELTILFADLLRNKAIKQYFVEEPECHLHPGLLRRLIVRLRSIPEVQFFITSHSNAVLDSLTEEDRVYRFGIETSSGTSVQRCIDLVERGRILDALGVSGSTLLQTNCVLWVEGPSDRIYLNHWMKHQSTLSGKSYLEGSDFAFVFYGGKVLSHFTFSEEGSEKLITLIRVCRFSAVLMDRDSDPADPSDEIRETKTRVVAEANDDPMHRLALYSIGREIENDVDPEVFRRAAARLLKIDQEKLAELKLDGSSRYAEQIVSHLALSGTDAKKALRKLKDKVSLAEAVVAEWTADAVVPIYVEELIRVIERSRLA